MCIRNGTMPAANGRANNAPWRMLLLRGRLFVVLKNVAHLESIHNRNSLVARRQYVRRKFAAVCCVSSPNSLKFIKARPGAGCPVDLAGRAD
jgi:hypothetical protein